MRQLPILLLILPMLAMLAVPAAADSSLWLHVRVDDDNGSKVNINVPISMAEKIVAMVPNDHMDDGRIILHDQEISVVDLRAIWAEIRSSPDMTFVTVDQQDDSARIWKQEGKLRIEVRGDDGRKADIKVPVEVVDALLSGDDNELAVGAAIAALGRSGGGEIVAVSDEENQVRVWVDTIAEAQEGAGQ